MEVQSNLGPDIADNDKDGISNISLSGSSEQTDYEVEAPGDRQSTGEKYNIYQVMRIPMLHDFFEIKVS